MATLYRCDRCQVVTTAKSELDTVTIPRAGESPDGYPMKKELCQHCLRQLHKFVKTIPERV